MDPSWFELQKRAVSKSIFGMQNASGKGLATLSLSMQKCASSWDVEDWSLKVPGLTSQSAKQLRHELELGETEFTSVLCAFRAA